MPASTIRSDYEGLGNIAKSFSTEADNLNNMNRNLQSNFQTLQGGDWIGQGANAFFQEWEQTVQPTLARLQQALSEAASVTQQISQTMKQAEEGAQQILHM